MENGRGWGEKLNQTYANQPKSFKESKVNETIHFLFTSIYDQFYLETAAWKMRLDQFKVEISKVSLFFQQSLAYKVCLSWKN